MKACIATLLTVAAASGQGVWESRAPLPVAATEVSSAPLNGKIYVVCGLLRQGNSRQTYVYDPRVDSWATVASLPIADGADHCNFAAASGKLYLLGGIRIGSSFIDGNTYEFDAVADRWQKVGEMKVPRGASGVTVIGSKIYVAGGLASGGSVNAFEVFDTVAKTWTTLPDMPTARDHLTAQAVGGKVYAIAGRSNRDLNVNEEFDPASNSWRSRAPLPTARGGLGSGVIGNRIQVFGGEGNSGTPQNTFAQNEEYDPANNSWRTLAPMPTPRHGLYGAVLDGRIFSPGGGPIAGANFSDANEVFYLPPGDRPVITSGRAGNAASFAEGAAPGGLVSVFGSNFSQGEQIATAVPLATRLNAVTAKVNGMPASLLFVSPGQVNLVFPNQIASGPATLVIGNAGSESAEVSIAVSDTQPGIFSLDGSGRGQGAILLAGTGLIARATRDAFSRAATRGGTVEIYCTGLGSLVEGRTPETPLVEIGGVRAQVVYAGAAPGFPGLDQVNAVVAPTAATGISVPVSMQIGGRSSNTVMIAVIE